MKVRSEDYPWVSLLEQKEVSSKLRIVWKDKNYCAFELRGEQL